MNSTLQGALTAAPDATVITDSHNSSSALASSSAGHIVLTEAAIESIPDGWYVFFPADALEAEKIAGLARRLSAPSLIAVSSTQAKQATSPTDVVAAGYPNLYSFAAETGTDSPSVVIISCGPSLETAKIAAQTLQNTSRSAYVVNLSTLRPLRLEEVAPVIRQARTIITATGHPLAAKMIDEISATVPGGNLHALENPTPEDIVAAADGTPQQTSTTPAPGSTDMGNRFADRLNRLGTENAFEVLAVVNKLKAEGRDIVSFAIGEPDFPTPANISMAGIQAITQDKTHYGESQGLRDLREAICAYIGRTRGLDVTPDMVVVTPGAKPILFNTVMSVVDPGDEVIYPNPGFPIYESLIDFVGAKGVAMPLWESLDFNFDPDEFRNLVTDKTKLIILNSPHNPTGSVLTPEALKVVAEVATERNVWVLSDEVYSQMVYDGEFNSIATLPGMLERTILLDGFSKTYSMTGWRLGFGIMPKELATWQSRIETNLNSCTATFTQWAGVEALNGSQTESLAMIAEFERRRKVIVDGLNEIPGFSCIMPHGAFYAFPNVTEACRMLGKPDAKALQEHILFEGNVAVLPRTSFGRVNTGEDQQYVRFSYASSMEMIEEGLKRLRELMS